MHGRGIQGSQRGQRFPEGKDIRAQSSRRSRREPHEWGGEEYLGRRNTHGGPDKLRTGIYCGTVWSERSWGTMGPWAPWVRGLDFRQDKSPSKEAWTAPIKGLCPLITAPSRYSFVEDLHIMNRNDPVTIMFFSVCCFTFWRILNVVNDVSSWMWTGDCLERRR